jgi:hypothetical protein
MQFSVSYLQSVVHLDGSGYRHVVWFTNSKREQGTANNFGQSKDRFQVYLCGKAPGWVHPQNKGASDKAIAESRVHTRIFTMFPTHGLNPLESMRRNYHEPKHMQITRCWRGSFLTPTP